MKKKIVFFVLLLKVISTTVAAQTPTDSVVQGARRYVARNFSEARTFNLYWETAPSHDYTLKQNGKEIENGRIRYMNTINFSATVPVLLLRNFSLYANGHFNSYQFEASDKVTDNISTVFSRNQGGYNYYEGTITGTYRTKIGNKPLLLTATGAGDGWNKNFEKVQAMLSAIVVLKQSATTSLCAGLYGTTLYDKLPVVPIITYWHQFNRDLSIDITLPSRTYLRYQFNSNQRFSIGASMENEHFYMESGIETLPKVSFFNKTTIKPGIVYEYIINNHFYLTARAGAAAIIKGGLYKRNRKSVNGDPYVEFTQPMTPFFNLGFSYNLFK